MRKLMASFMLFIQLPAVAIADGCLSVGDERLTVTIDSPVGSTPEMERMGLELFAMLRGGTVLSYANACEDLTAAEREGVMEPEVTPAAMLGLAV